MQFPSKCECITFVGEDSTEKEATFIDKGTLPRLISTVSAWKGDQIGRKVDEIGLCN